MSLSLSYHWILLTYRILIVSRPQRRTSPVYMSKAASTSREDGARILGKIEAQHERYVRNNCKIVIISLHSTYFIRCWSADVPNDDTLAVDTERRKATESRFMVHDVWFFCVKNDERAVARLHIWYVPRGTYVGRYIKEANDFLWRATYIAGYRQ